MKDDIRNTGARQRRREFRRRSLMSGAIRFGARRSTLHCVVRNLSVGGAKLQVTNAMWLPEHFELDIEHQDIRVDVRVIWRELGEAGVSFLPYERRIGRSMREDEEMRAILREQKHLQRRVRELSEDMPI